MKTNDVVEYDGQLYTVVDVVNGNVILMSNDYNSLATKTVKLSDEKLILKYQ